MIYFVIGTTSAVCLIVVTAAVLAFWSDWSGDVAKLHGIIERQRIENGRLRKLLAQYQGEQSGS